MTLSYTYPVYLVGAGPGDPGLITVRGEELLAKADIIIYDYLASSTLLDKAKPAAKLIFVGKKGFSEHVSQEEINACLIHEATSCPGACIVRLKGGDPFVFGRGGEEALALAQAHIPFEIVPGITSGIAAPAYAGIPVTHRGIASSVAFITGHETPEKNESSLNWEHLAHGVDTLCFYMGIHNLPLIATNLIAAGRAPSTPIVLIRWGSLPLQETLTSTLEHVVDDVKRAAFEAPAIIVVGKVTNLRPELTWFEQRPLFGRSIMVTRSRPQASVLTAQLRELGAHVFSFPTIHTVSLGLTPAVKQAISSLSSYDWVVFTSANGVSHFFEELHKLNEDARAFATTKIAAIGPATADALLRYGLRADLVPREYIAEAIADDLLAGADKDPCRKVLILRAEQAREALPDILQMHKVDVDIVSVYRTEQAGEDLALEAIEQLEAGTVDAITFTSSSTVKNCFNLLAHSSSGGEDKARELLSKTRLFSIGPITSATLRDLGLSPAAEACNYTIPGLIDVLRKEL